MRRARSGARAAVRGARVGDRGGFHGSRPSWRPRPRRGGRRARPACRSSGARARSGRTRSQPDFVSGKVEITMSSTRKYCSAFMIAVYGSGSPIIPAANRPRTCRRSSDELQPGAGAARGVAVAALLRHDDDEQLRRSCVGLGCALAVSASSSSSPEAVRLATASVTWKGSPSASMSLTMWVDRQPGGVPDALDQVAAQPSRAGLRVGGDDDLVGLVLVDGVDRRRVRVRIADLADRAGSPSARTNSSARSTRTWAASNTASS